MTLKEFYANRIIDFLKVNAKYVFERLPKEVVRQHILAHLDYETIVVVWDGGEIASVCAFNINGEEAEIIDCVVAKKYRFKKMLQKMTMIALQRYPSVKSLVFERWVRNKDMKQHHINIDFLLKHSSLIGV